MGCEAALKPCASVNQTYRIRRLYCRCATDRRQAGLLRPPARSGPLAPTNGPAARSKSLAPTNARRLSSPRRHSASAAGVGALGGYDGSDGLRSGPETMRLGTSDIPHSQVSLPLRDRSSASRTPTAFGQRRTPRANKRPPARGETLAPIKAFGQKRTPRANHGLRP